MTLGPGPTQVGVTGNLALSHLFSTDARTKRQAEAAFIRAIKGAVPGLTASNMKRLLEENERGFVASTTSGERLFPRGRDLSEQEAYARFLGFQPRTLVEEYEALDDSKFIVEARNSILAELKQEAFDQLDDKRPGAEVVANLAVGLRDLATTTREYGLLTRAAQRIGDIFKEYNEKRTLTQRERRERRAPGPLTFRDLLDG
jgi:hypothetical protein